MSEYEKFIERSRARHGDALDTSELSAKFRGYFRSGDRIRVRREYSDGEVYERTGQVGVTTGWRPAFLLMHRSSDCGSSDVLSERDNIVAVKRQGARQYVAVEQSQR